MKKPETKLIADKEIGLDQVILEYLSTKDDNYGNTNVFFKVANPTTVENVMKIDTRMPMWSGEDDDILLKVKSFVPFIFPLYTLHLSLPLYKFYTCHSPFIKSSNHTSLHLLKLALPFL